MARKKKPQPQKSRRYSRRTFLNTYQVGHHYDISPEVLYQALFGDDPYRRQSAENQLMVLPVKQFFGAMRGVCQARGLHIEHISQSVGHKEMLLKAVRAAA